MSVGRVKKVLVIDTSTLICKRDLFQLAACRRTPRVRNYVTTVYVPTIPFCSKIRFRNQFTDSEKSNVEDQAFSCYVTAAGFSARHRTLAAEKTKARSTTVPRAKLPSRLMVILERLQPSVWNKRNAEKVEIKNCSGSLRGNMPLPTGPEPRLQ